jgi:hypothetical protein
MIMAKCMKSANDFLAAMRGANLEVNFRIEGQNEADIDERFCVGRGFECIDVPTIGTSSGYAWTC